MGTMETGPERMSGMTWGDGTMAAAGFTSEGTSVIDMVRRRRASMLRSSAAAAAAHVAAPAPHATTSSAQLGVISRRYGLMTCEEAVVVQEIVASSGDLAVADRLAFIASMERRSGLVVIAANGEYHACIVDAALDQSSLGDFVAATDAPRVMSIVSDRGITPALGPLACA